MVVSGSCSNEEDVLSSDPSLDAAVLRSNHKEADRRLVLHEVGHVDDVVVSARDTGVLLLLLAHRAKLSSGVTWAGTSEKPKCVPLEGVSANLPRNSSSALLQIHAITGCESTSFTGLWTFKEDCVDSFHRAHLIFSSRWAKTSSMLTPSHPQKSLLVECIRHQRTHLTWLASCYLATSVAQKSYHRLATRSSYTWRDDTTKPRRGARRAFRNQCFRTQRRQTGR